ncbi:ABC transporter ATP-binding protein [Pasteurella multocida]|uniref:ABC transporter ATP-binding protein n=1 Tax=Pasteurella multocida TaxID=747 RepID=UPI00397D0C00
MNMDNMVISLDCGAEVIIQHKDNKYQLFEVLEYIENHDTPWSKGMSTRPIGLEHKDINNALGELLYFALNEYETLSLNEMSEVVKATMNKIEEWFKLHSEYLATL